MERNVAAVDTSLENLHELPLGASVTADAPSPAGGAAPTHPTSCSGSPLACSPARATCCPSARCRPTARSSPATSQWEKRTIAAEIPIWEPDLCIDCGKCAIVCPHAAIRMKVYEPAALDAAAASS